VGKGGFLIRESDNREQSFPNTVLYLNGHGGKLSGGREKAKRESHTDRGSGRLLSDEGFGFSMHFGLGLAALRVGFSSGAMWEERKTNLGMERKKWGIMIIKTRL